MHIFFNTNKGQCIFSLIQIQVNVYFFNTNAGQCIFLIDPFLSLIEVNVYFLNTNTDQCMFF